MKSNEPSFLAIIGMFVLALGGFCSGGAVLYLNWGWFVAPLGVPDVGFWHAVGLAITIGICVKHIKVDEDDRDASDVISSLVRAHATIWFCMLIAAWPASALMG